MIYTIFIPADLEWLIHLVSDFFALIRKAYQDDNRVIYNESKMENTDEQLS